MFWILDNTGINQPFLPFLTSMKVYAFSFQLMHVFKGDFFQSILAILLNPTNPRRMSVSFSRERTPDELGEEF